MASALLKAAATALTLAAALATALHVAGHVKDSAAPLHPEVLGAPAVPAGKLTLSPSVRRADVQPVTATTVS